MIGFFDTHIRLRLLAALMAVLAMLNASLIPTMAQSPDQAAPRSFNEKQLEQLLAPIALYPDALLTHILMGACYPLEIVQAERWRRTNPDVKGPELEQAMQRQSWDESVKALTAFPQVLQMMSDRLEWTQELGEAFLAQQTEVFAAVQTLRQRAEAAGKLKTSKKLRVSDESRDGAEYIAIEPAGPDEIYVPVYDPTVVYGVWPYDDYPPYYWYPSGWDYPSDYTLWFGSAVVLGTALWATWNWRRRNIAIDARRYNAFNRTNVTNPAWAFKPQHRKGVPFKAQALSKRFGPIAAPTRAQRATLQQFRGKGTQPKHGPATTKIAPKGITPPTHRGGAKQAPAHPTHAPSVTRGPAHTRQAPARSVHRAAPRSAPAHRAAPTHRAAPRAAPTHRAAPRAAPTHRAAPRAAPMPRAAPAHRAAPSMARPSVSRPAASRPAAAAPPRGGGGGHGGRKH